MNEDVRRGWGPVHGLAALGLVFVGIQLWTYGGWLADGPHAVRQYRDHASASWAVARVYEAVVVVMAVVMLVWVVRGVRRAGRVTFDAKLCIAAAATYWIDPIGNWVQPTLMYSSNWVNLQDWSGHSPFVVNPDAGRMPEPVLYIGLWYAFGLLTFLLALNAGMRWARRRWPRLSNFELVVLTVLAATLIDVVFELPMFLLQLWAYPGAPDIGLMMHSSKRLPLIELIVTSLVFGGLAALRFFKDDRGRAAVERGLDHVSPRRAGLLSSLALVAVLNLTFLVVGFIEIGVGFYSAPYRRMPAHIVNGQCDAPGIHGTRYGPCPGSPGYRIPLRGSLPGDRP